MRIELPDVNVLLALFDPVHPHHDMVSSWYARAAYSGWATCPLTENGFVRILSSASYPGVRLRVEEVLKMLETAIANPVATHHFWQDRVSLRDPMLFIPSAIEGHKQITDAYLLGLCQQNEGTLVTLDAKMSTASIHSPHADLLRIL